MAGFRDFQTGEVLTAANVNDFLAKQAVMKFADAAARDTALGTAVGGGNALREGMVAYLDDEDLPSFYNGTSWTTEFGGGGLVAVKHAIFKGTQTNSTPAGNDFAVTDLSITHEVADPSNKLIITAFLGLAASSIGHAQVGLAVSDGTSILDRANAAGSRTLTMAGGIVAGDGGSGTASARIATMPSVSFVHSPGSGSKTYTVRAVNVWSSTATIYINRYETDADSAVNARGSSGFVIQEVKV